MKIWKPAAHADSQAKPYYPRQIPNVKSTPKANPTPKQTPVGNVKVIVKSASPSSPRKVRKRRELPEGEILNSSYDELSGIATNVIPNELIR